jgi:hypothetical protein
MSNSNPKKYKHNKILFKSKCIDPTGMLFPGWRNIIDFTETQYLVKFNSGAAKWYSKKRFVGKFKTN